MPNEPYSHHNWRLQDCKCHENKPVFDIQHLSCRSISSALLLNCYLIRNFWRGKRHSRILKIVSEKRYLKSVGRPLSFQLVHQHTTVMAGRQEILCTCRQAIQNSSEPKRVSNLLWMYCHNPKPVILASECLTTPMWIPNLLQKPLKAHHLNTSPLRHVPHSNRFIFRVTDDQFLYKINDWRQSKCLIVWLCLRPKNLLWMEHHRRDVVHVPTQRVDLPSLKETTKMITSPLPGKHDRSTNLGVIHPPQFHLPVISSWNTSKVSLNIAV